jgi:apolipoprotein D and lipocalin family protein
MKRKRLVIVLLSLFFSGCTAIPDGLVPVTGFEAKKYLGKWYEIARLDHRFEKNMSNVSAVYTETDDGYISVLNRGYDETKKKWKQISGKARFISDGNTGSLKVSFFGPFYGGYHIIALDKDDYHYAMVAGPKRSYLWILARSRSMDEKILADLVSQAAKWGFETDKLIYVKQEQ